MHRMARLPALLLAPVVLSAQQRVPYHYAEDFASGEPSGWTSYPPVQDVAYDPTLTPLHRSDGFSMGRVVQPTHDGRLEIGLIRRMSFVAASNLRLGFEVALEPAGITAPVEVGLAARSGNLYRAAARLGTVRLAAGDFKLKPGEEIEAVYIIARIAQASAAIEYTFRLDHVSLDAERPPRAEVSDPKLVGSHGWEMRVASRVYHEGEELRVRGARLIGPDGAPRAASGPFTSSDPAGLWEARLPDGSSFVFLLAKRPGAHPRAFDLAELRRRAGSPDFAQAWQRVRDRAAQTRRQGLPPAFAGDNFVLLYPDHLLPALQSYMSVLGRVGGLVLTNAMVAAIEDNAEACQAAKEGLLLASGWPTWTPPWFPAHGMHTYYPVGIFAREMALGYDLLYASLNESERAKVRRALRELDILPTWREHYLDARMPFATSNWIANTISGALASIAVTDGEDPGQNLSPMLTGLFARMREHIRETILSDGSSGEPLGYEDFDLEGVSWTGAVFEHAYGIDLRAGTSLDRAHLYAIYDRISPREFPDMGDGDLHGSRGFAWLAAKSEDGRLRQLYRGTSHDPIGELAIGPSGEMPGGPPLEPGRYFEKKGSAILRSGWDPGATVFAFRAGPHFNHNHMDAGTFFLSSGGERLLTEAGVSHYYNDPHYGSHFIQAIGHNVMLVDGNRESQVFPDFLWVRALDRRPHWHTALLSDAADLLRVDLHAVYRAPLESYQRAILYVRPGYFVLCDRVAAREPHTFSWLFHAPAAEDAKLRLDGDAFTIDRQAVSLAATLAGTTDVKLHEREFPQSVGALDGLTRQKLYVRHYVEAVAAPASDAAVIAVLCPLKPGQPAPKVERTAGALAVQVGGTDLVAFKQGGKAVNAAGAETDGDCLFLRSSGGAAIEALAVDGATRVAWRSREVLSSPSPVTLSASWSGGTVHGTVRCARSTTFSLAGARVTAPAGESKFSATAQ